MTLEGYLSASQKADEPFLFWYRLVEDGQVERTDFARGAVFSLARKAAGLLLQCGVEKGGRVLHCFGANEWEDLAFRLGAWMIGAAPVTVNWQADTRQRVFYKLERTRAGAVVYSPSFDGKILDGLREKYKGLFFIDASQLRGACCKPPPPYQLHRYLRLGDPEAGKPYSPDRALRHQLLGV